MGAVKRLILKFQYFIPQLMWFKSMKSLARFKEDSAKETIPAKKPGE